jgi:hypothetical protein
VTVVRGLDGFEYFRMDAGVVVAGEASFGHDLQDFCRIYMIYPVHREKSCESCETKPFPP